jgi:hypothetical protein
MTVSLGASTTVTLPLTGLTVTSICDRQNAPPPYSPNGAVARITLAAPTGTMDAIVVGVGSRGGTIGGTSFTHSFQGVLQVGDVLYGGSSMIASANDATATITYGAQLSEPAATCLFRWQATEAPD